MSKKLSKKKMLIIELSSIRRVRGEMMEKRPSWFKEHDFARLDREFTAKSAELVELEIKTFEKRMGKGVGPKTSS